MTDYLDKKHEAARTLQGVVTELRYIANAFRMTGNREIAEDLRLLAMKAEEANEQHEEAFGELFNQSVRATQDASMNMVKAALAVAIARDGGSNERCPK